MNAPVSRKHLVLAARIAGLAAVAMTASACLVMPYHSPTEGPVADIQINNLSPRIMAISFYEDSDTCRERHNLLPITQPGQTRDLKVDASKEATITLSQDVSYGYGCIGTFTFRPIEGRKYVIDFRQSEGVCRSTFQDVTTSVPQTVEFENRVWKVAFDEHGPFCDAR